jgi:hypothetical protein
VLVLWKPQGVPSVQAVASSKLATGGVFSTGAAVTVTLLVTEWVKPSASPTVRVTGYVPAAAKVKEADDVVTGGVGPAPSKSQLYVVTASSSVLVLAKLQAVPATQLVGGTKLATGASFSPPPLVGGSSPPQPDPSTRTAVATASKRIDRIGSSQPRVTVCPRKRRK